MKYRHFYIIILLFSFWSYNAFSQINCITDSISPPVLTLVSVEAETGNTKFTWTLSPSPGIAAYVLYSYENGDGMPFPDTIKNPLATSYTLSSTVTKYKSVSYVVTAMRLLPRCTSKFSNILNSIFTDASLDTCKKKIVVSWNSYPSFPVEVTGYSVLLSVNGGSYNELKNAGPGETSFTLNEFTINAEYCFVVRANLKDDTFSTSNKKCLSTQMQRPHQWINADQATINSDGKVALSFTIDQLSEIKHLSLERRIGTAGTFQEISQPVSVNGSIRFTDNQAEKNNINYYRL